MTYSEELADKIRKALAKEKLEEKKLFGGLAFMVNGKMCVTASSQNTDHSMMVRVDPKIHEELIKRKGARTAVMRGKEYKGWIFLAQEAIQSERDFKEWIDVALAYNKINKIAKLNQATK